MMAASRANLGKWVAAVVAIVTILLLVANVWLVVALGIGLVVGAYVRLLAKAPRAIIKWTAIVTASCLLGVVLLFALSEEKGRDYYAQTVPVEDVGASYEIAADYSPEASTWMITEQLVVPEMAVEYVREAVERAAGADISDSMLSQQLKAQMALEDFHIVRLRDGLPVYQRERLEPVVVGWYPPRNTSEIAFELAVVDLSALTDGYRTLVQFVPDDGSDFVLTTPKRMVFQAFPPILSREDRLDGREEVTLPLRYSSLVTLELVDGLWRTALAAPLLKISLSPIIWGMVAILGAAVTGLLGDYVKAWLKNAVRILSSRKRFAR
ncbi:MAG: hypothetical protein ACRDTH_17655 [Pseudonocardiaceae bacterium]